MIPEILVLSDDDVEMGRLEQSVGNYALLIHARTVPKMISHLQEGTANTLFCSWDFYSTNRYEVREAVQHHQPDLPVVILTHDTEAGEWAEALDVGAFDLLDWACQESTAHGAMQRAPASREAQKARKYLIQNQSKLLAS